MSFAEYLIAELAMNAGVYNSMLLVWQEKLRADAVRPVTLVPRILGGGRDSAFVPPIRTMPHSEYPSASACVCTAFTDALRYFGGDAPEVSHVFEFPPNRFRPGVPPRALTVRFSNLAAISSTCGDSRVWGGASLSPGRRRGPPPVHGDCGRDGGGVGLSIWSCLPRASAVQASASRLSCGCRRKREGFFVWGKLGRHRRRGG
ncbi:hypothetical protein I4F81_002204 [Pyropia yezoensis]|uniref:Uncharacterized protein n=1 Tax=Pyropia yezoensis TaxID=2788 RepID=A0ACC3BNN9_PYRYE|nr:hypothetical protein I4F81_002204 [Neopyropia yezoensis]